jgi:hypothetical protein
LPWNYPIFLSFGPLTGAVAAGNRAMVKMSENSRRLAELLAGISPKYLPEDKLAFFADDALESSRGRYGTVRQKQSSPTEDTHRRKGQEHVQQFWGFSAGGVRRRRQGRQLALPL